MRDYCYDGPGCETRLTSVRYTTNEFGDAGAPDKCKLQKICGWSDTRGNLAQNVSRSVADHPWVFVGSYPQT